MIYDLNTSFSVCRTGTFHQEFLWLLKDICSYSNGTQAFSSRASENRALTFTYITWSYFFDVVCFKQCRHIFSALAGVVILFQNQCHQLSFQIMPLQKTFKKPVHMLMILKNFTNKSMSHLLEFRSMINNTAKYIS